MGRIDLTGNWPVDRKFVADAIFAWAAGRRKPGETRADTDWYKVLRAGMGSLKCPSRSSLDNWKALESVSIEDYPASSIVKLSEIIDCDLTNGFAGFSNFEQNRLATVEFQVVPINRHPLHESKSTHECKAIVKIHPVKVSVFKIDPAKLDLLDQRKPTAATINKLWVLDEDFASTARSDVEFASNAPPELWASFGTVQIGLSLATLCLTSSFDMESELWALVPITSDTGAGEPAKDKHGNRALSCQLVRDMDRSRTGQEIVWDISVLPGQPWIQLGQLSLEALASYQLDHGDQAVRLELRLRNEDALHFEFAFNTENSKYSQVDVRRQMIERVLALKSRRANNASAVAESIIARATKNARGNDER